MSLAMGAQTFTQIPWNASAWKTGWAQPTQPDPDLNACPASSSLCAFRQEFGVLRLDLFSIRWCTMTIAYMLLKKH